MPDRARPFEQPATLLFGLVLLALVTRGWLVYTGGIWADEGFVFSVVTMPSWGSMLEFLRLHESHPPLFYILIRAWSQVFGATDTALLALPLVISLLIVPVIYLAGKSMFGRDPAIVAATVAAMSPSLAEHAAQLRPYGLLPVLVTVACVSLIRAMEYGGRRNWGLFGLATTMLLYTHHWTWLVGGGMFVAAMDFQRRLPVGRRMPALREALAATVVTAVLYAPWYSAFLHQVRETGHVALPLEGTTDFLLFAIFGALSVPYMLAFGSVPDTQLLLVLFSIGATLVTLAVVHWWRKMHQQLAGFRPAGIDRESEPRRRFLLIVTIVAVVVGIALSPRSNMLLDRCVAMLSPLVILALASWLVERHAQAGTLAMRRLLVAIGIFLCWLGLANLVAISRTIRSNASQVAAEISSARQESDLLIIAPEWFAPSFNHYFPPSLEQIDYPQDRRSEAVTFDGVRARHADTVALARLRTRIASARNSGRRVWLVTARRYLRFVDERLPHLSEAKKARFASVVQIGQARDALVAQFGPPDTTHFVRTASPRYDELLPLLFVPPSDKR
jgi:mannosyltransferase